jgi:hypothetical protein
MRPKTLPGDLGWAPLQDLNRIGGIASTLGSRGQQSSGDRTMAGGCDGPRKIHSEEPGRRSSPPAGWNRIAFPAALPCPDIFPKLPPWMPAALFHLAAIDSLVLSARDRTPPRS